jgi:N-acetylglucosaminyldiphosphoundecaprenol N-acetyl-beta-D-mannosaminyltransferase
MNHKDLASIEYNGVKVSNICYRNVVSKIEEAVSQKRPGYVCLTDVSNLIVATKNIELQKAINGSLLSLADGMPLVWYAWLTGCEEIERISGASLMERLISDLGGYKHYLLGDTEGTIEKVMKRARLITPQIDIEGHSPPFKEFDEFDNEDMLGRIRASRPDVIWVCFGGVKQETWMKRNINCLDSGVMIGVGAAFRFFIGEIVTPAPIFQRLGLQWLFRLTEAFVRNPVQCMKVVHQRHILTSKIEYLARLPFEVVSARKRIKNHMPRKP